jgi:hypothetical protein
MDRWRRSSFSDELLKITAESDQLTDNATFVSVDPRWELDEE